MSSVRFMAEYMTKLAEYMTKLSAGLKTVSYNYIVVENSTNDLRMQWADIAAAWRAAGQPSPAVFKDAHFIGVDKAVVQECLLLATR